MILTDTHAHLYSEAFKDDQDEMIKRCFDSSVERVFLPAIDSEHIDSMISLQRKYPNNMFLMAGLHPTYVKADFEKEIKSVLKMLDNEKCYAVGEIGIDLYWDKTFLNEQKKAFQKQIQIAKERDLPIVIHCRDAFDEVFEVLEMEKDEKLRGIFHCFTGDYEQALKAISYNLKLGIGGVVTFKNGKIDQFINQIDLKHIVLETDSPYLAPKPYRGKRNESSYLVQVADKLSDLYEIPIEEIANITTKNSIEVFGV